MEDEEAEILDVIVHNQDETLTTNKLAAYCGLPEQDVQDILDGLEDQLLVTVGVKTPEGYYDIAPTMRAHEYVTQPVMDVGPDIDPLSHHQRGTVNV